MIYDGALTVNYLCSAQQLHASSPVEGPQLLEKLDNFSSEYTCDSEASQTTNCFIMLCKNLCARKPSLIKIEQPALWLQLPWTALPMGIMK